MVPSTSVIQFDFDDSLVMFRSVTGSSILYVHFDYFNEVQLLDDRIVFTYTPKGASTKVSRHLTFDYCSVMRALVVLRHFLRFLPEDFFNRDALRFTKRLPI